MVVRDNNRIKRGSAEYEIIKKQILDLYVITENATTCYDLWRRAIAGEDYKGTNRANASSFFKKEENAAYIDQRKVELARWGFELYSQLMSLDISEIRKKEDKYGDIESLTPDELRTKNLVELEELKLSADDNLKAQIIKQQTDLMDAKRKDQEEQATDKYIHYYLPMPYCNECPKKPNHESKETGIHGEEEG